ncbi:MAG TPA: TetR family transcriptional regulator [Pseudonocardiaceae bacterium]|jgi:AcrR family transcriptional regulator|nr:TetR family transcriptional regulator [Pseudonocardiaceae bacterium]
MSRAEATKGRILAAATAEFSAYGIAGARVDRIAASAEANKNLIYVYFSSKDKLFDAVFDANVVRVMDEVPFTAEDLPGYAGRLFDFYLAHPELLRLATWHRLERGGDSANGIAAVEDSYRHKLDSIASVQRDGAVDPSLSPSVLLTLVLAISAAWGSASPSVVPSYPGRDSGEGACRAAIVDAVARLMAPAGSAAGQAGQRPGVEPPRFSSPDLPVR